MPELSNLLRQRLGAVPDGNGTHPDADTLTALTEQLLPAAERQRVLTHLSACGQCREVLALSQPQIPELVTQPTIKPATASSWRRLFTPRFGLAAAAAAIAVIAIVVLQSPQKPVQKQQAAQQAKVSPAPETTADARVVAPPPPALPPPAFNEADAAIGNHPRNREKTIGGLAARATAPSPAAPSAAAPSKDLASRQPVTTATGAVSSAGFAKKDFVNTGLLFANSTENFEDNLSSNGLPPAPEPHSARTDARLTANASGPITIFQDIPPASAANKSNMRILTPLPPPEKLGCPLCKIVERGALSVLHRPLGAVPAINSNGLALSAMGGQGKFSADLQKEQPAEVEAAPEKPATVDGLQRFESLSRRSMSGAAYAATDSTVTLWKVMGGKLARFTGAAQWEDAYPGASFQFLFVSSRGNEVWAGGTHTSLIHSTDGGKTWEALKLGDAASGSITSIVFSGSTVQVKTSDDQAWSSADGGKTWAQN